MGSTLTVVALVVDLAIRIGLSIRVVMRRLPVGVTLAWLNVVLVFPFLGAGLYLLFGELRIGRWRARRAEEFEKRWRDWARALDGDSTRALEGLPAGAPTAVARVGRSVFSSPVLGDNRIDLFTGADEALRAVVADVDAALRTCHFEFYIWSRGGLADEVAEALIRAARRGVDCRVLVDAVGSRPFLRSDLARRMRDAGVQVRDALAAGLFRALFVRFDLRLHRKIVAIDGRVAHTGSLNMVDPRYFKQDAGVGEWVDAMARVEGPAAAALEVCFLQDWAMETGESLDVQFAPRAAQGTDGALVQVLPSGPSSPMFAIQEVLLNAIYAARRELVLTTPYFVPDEMLLAALMSAARSGVDVKLIVPAKVDSLLVRFASQAQRGDLALAGVAIHQYVGGLLHTKSVTVDGELSLFGSLNLDPRSLHLNFEITLAIYDRGFTGRLRALQETYLAKSIPFDLERFQKKRFVGRLAQDAARLVGPLL